MELVEGNAFTTKRPHRNSVIMVAQSAHVKLQKGKIYRESKFSIIFIAFLILIPKHGLVSMKVCPLPPLFLVGYWEEISSACKLCLSVA